MLKLNDYLRGKTLVSGGYCYGSVIHFEFQDGGAFETAGGDWTIEIEGVSVENSDDVSSNLTVKTLAGRTIRELTIISTDACTITFWDGVILRCRNSAYDGYEMGCELLNIFQIDDAGRTWICEVHAPLIDLEWRYANRPVSAAY